MCVQDDVLFPSHAFVFGVWLCTHTVYVLHAVESVGVGRRHIPGSSSSRSSDGGRTEEAVEVAVFVAGGDDGDKTDDDEAKAKYRGEATEHSCPVAIRANT